MAIKDRAERRVKHIHEFEHPHQEKFSVPVLGMEDGSTALPVDHHSINTLNNAGTVREYKTERPIYDDLDSFAIHHSHTNGRDPKE
jgi:hypothetical protein